MEICEIDVMLSQSQTIVGLTLTEKPDCLDDVGAMIQN